jgi:hypothetical protein
MSLGAQGMIVSNRNNLKLLKIYRKPKMLGVFQKVDNRHSYDINPKAALPLTKWRKV